VVFIVALLMYIERENVRTISPIKIKKLQI